MRVESKQPRLMASNLHIDGELHAQWAEAQKPSASTRFLVCKIEGESIKLAQHVDRQRAAMADFDTVLKPSMSETEPALVIFLVKEGKWLLIAWTPDAASVRDKMLYASCRDTLKKALVAGGGDFEPDYAAQEPDELTWKAYFHRYDDVRDRGLMTEKEQILTNTLAEERQRQAEMVNDAKNIDKGAGIIPFKVEDGCKEALASFSSTSSSNTSILEMSVQDEVISLVSSDLDLSEDVKFHTLVSATEARFLLIRKSGKVVFVMSSPEDLHVRVKMVLSSSKATVMQKVADEGINIDENIEIRDPIEIDEAIERKLTPPGVAESGVFTGTGTSSDTSTTTTRPKAKGRAPTKRAVAKFKADDDD